VALIRICALSTVKVTRVLHLSELLPVSGNFSELAHRAFIFLLVEFFADIYALL
jgi:hypothetical protein